MYKKILGGGLALAAGAYARGAAVKRQVGQYARFWEQSNVAIISRLLETKDRGEDLPLVMVALGDSCAQGIGADHPHGGYVPRVAAALRAMTGREVALINFSISGAVLPTVASHQVPALAGLYSNDIHPDVVTLDIGSNDVMGKAPLEAIGAYALTLAGSMPPGAFISDVPTFGPGWHGRRAEAVSVALRNAFSAHHLVPLEARTKELRFVRDYLGLHAGDLFHPNEKYYEMWAQAWADTIAPTIDAPTVAVSDVSAYEPWICPDPEDLVEG